MVISKGTSTTAVTFQSAISPVILWKLSSSSFVQVLLWLYGLGNAGDDDCGNPNLRLEKAAVTAITLFVNASTRFSYSFRLNLIEYPFITFLLVLEYIIIIRRC